MALYMKVEGIQGDVTEEGHPMWIEITSFNWGAGRSITSPKNSGADREGAEAAVSEISVNKVNDVASTGLLRLALWGKGKKVEIHFTRTGSDKKQVPYLKYELDDVLFSSYSVGSTGERPAESLTLNFTKITYSNIDSKKSNDDNSPDRVQYDLTTGVGS
jgi:type VI secretion system secreted protein Hcp